MQNALRAAGIHPKNNLVDITNYVLFELGQPLHAFDARKIEGRRIVVKTCAEGTPFVTLDGVERKLSDRDLMICSAERPMCIGGVFGGLASGVGDDTTDIFLESAYFNPVWVRKTAKRHGLNTDSSWRFERGVDPRLQVYALKRAALLFKELAGGRISSAKRKRSIWEQSSIEARTISFILFLPLFLFSVHPFSLSHFLPLLSAHWFTSPNPPPILVFPQKIVPF